MSFKETTSFAEIWLFDFEFSSPPGFTPRVRCLVANEIRSGRIIRVFEPELLEMKYPPYNCDEDTLFVAFYASSEISCHIALGWPVPRNLLDLYVEFRVRTNGLYLPNGNGLIGALSHYGLNSISIIEKQEMRDLAIRGGPYSEEEKMALLNYCESDVEALKLLLEKMHEND